LSGRSAVSAESDRPPVLFSAASTLTSVAPGESVDIVCTFAISKAWHIYWTDPGTSGAPTDIEVLAPKGVTVGKVRMSRPSVLAASSGRVYAFEDEAIATVHVDIPSTAAVGSSIDVVIRADWLVCKEACFAGSGHATVRIDISAESGLPTLAAELLASLPKPIRMRPHTRMWWSASGRDLVITGPVSTKGPPRVLLNQVPGVSAGQPEVVVDSKRFKVTLPVHLEPNNSLDHPPCVRGLLVFGPSRYDPAWSFEFACGDGVATTH
ncbi:MAG TPA: protein-disulfide reductase DsbD family protein, partial [Phycisphaerales bacterium]|nr:protein-disulfide reductase DsbD family protein [Phycisphaerales bacterium]